MSIHICLYIYAYTYMSIHICLYVYVYTYMSIHTYVRRLGFSLGDLRRDLDPKIRFENKMGVLGSEKKIWNDRNLELN